MRKGLLTLLQQTRKFDFNSIMDIGTGDGFAARFFNEIGKKVTVTGYDMDAYLSAPIPESIAIIKNVDVCAMIDIPDESFDAVWCCHVLEHVLNPGLALCEMRRILKPDGYLFLVLPEYAPYLVGGHVTPGWNLGVLMYVLILSGFDVRNGEFINHCWNITGFVKKGEPVNTDVLRFDKGDLEILSRLFPDNIVIQQGMDAELSKISWKWHPSIAADADAEFRRSAFRRRLQEWIPWKLRKIVWLFRNAHKTA